MPDKGADLKWVEFFKATNCSNLQKLIELVLSVPVSNAPVERLFSIMKNLWTDQRNRMCVELVEPELLVKTIYRMTCAEFYNFVLGQKPLLKAVRSNLKYFFKSKS